MNMISAPFMRVLTAGLDDAREGRLLTFDEVFANEDQPAVTRNDVRRRTVDQEGGHDALV